MLWFSVNAAAKPALNASPAPVVSTTRLDKFAIGDEKLSLLLAKNVKGKQNIVHVDAESEAELPLQRILINRVKLIMKLKNVSSALLKMSPAHYLKNI